MNDINPQNDGDHTPSERNPYTGDGVHGTSGDSVPSPASDTPQHQDPQADTPQHNASQPTQQYGHNAQQATSPYNAYAQAPQYASSQPSPQYGNPQQTPNSVPPRFPSGQSSGGQGGAPVFPGNMSGQPYGNPGPNNFAAPMAVPLNMPYYDCPPIEAVRRFFLKYVKFSGRASRSEYWWSQLFIFLVFIVISALGQAIPGKSTGFIGNIWELAIIIPQISIAVRRLHDSNKSGWWWLLPYGLYIAAVIVMAISIGIGIGVGAAMNPSILVSKAFGAGIIGGVIAGFLCLFAGAILQIVLMVLGPNPQGARFDETPALAPFADGQYMPPMNQGNPAGNQYGQYPQQSQQPNPFNQPYPQAPNQPVSANNPYQAPNQSAPATNPYAQPGNSQASAPGEPQYQTQNAPRAEAPAQNQNPFGQQSPQSGNRLNTGDGQENNGNSSVR